MWVFMSGSAISVVAHRDSPSKVIVRAREVGDLIEFMGTDRGIFHDATADYPWRVIMFKGQLAKHINRYIMDDLTYDNFKGSVDDNQRHDWYMDVWQSGVRWANGWYARIRTQKELPDSEWSFEEWLKR